MKYLILVLFSFILVFSSCKKTDEEEYFPDSNAALAPAADQFIIPSYSLFGESLENLNLARQSFFNSPELPELQSLRQALKQARKDWQFCSAIDFGPAVDFDLAARMNVFPLDYAQMNTRISSGETSFAHAQWGLPALGYLIHGDDEEVISRFTATLSAQYRSYFTAILEDITVRNNNVLSAWNSGYRDQFVNATGSAAGSGMSLLVNAMIQDFEKLKRDKIALPLGLLTLGIVLPEKVEAYFGEYSVELASVHCKAIHSLFLGRSRIDEVDLFGIDDLLDERSARYNGENLSTAISNQFQSARNQLELIPDPLSQSVIDEAELVESAYQELQEIVVFLKTDMPSSLGIALNFSDNDGD